MSIERQRLFCCDACENHEMVRSFGTCPKCNKTWNGKGDGASQNYRNNAWNICNTCSQKHGLCVVCCSSIPQNRLGLK